MGFWAYIFGAMKRIDGLIKMLFGPGMAKWYILFFVVYYSAISLVNHYMFRTSSDPLGIYTNAIYDYAHFRPNDCTLLSPLNAKLEDAFFDNKLSDHFTTTQFLFAPFYKVFGTYTLLLFQLLAILIGGWGVFKYFKEFSKNVPLATMAMVHFFWVFGIHSALAFDYHDNVVGAMIIPWLFYFMRKEKWLAFGLTWVLIISCKENLSILLAGIFGVFVLFPLKKNMGQRLAAGLTTLASLAYFLVVTKWVMPSLANEGRETYLHFNYGALGESYGDAISFAITHPWETFKMLFVNHTGSRFGDGIKTELYIILALSGGFAWFLKPRWLLMAIPIIAQKVLNDQMLKWGINYHYNIELVPLLTFGLFEWLSTKEWSINWSRIAFACVFLTMGTTVVKYVGRTAKWYDPYRQNPFSPTHYSREFNVRELSNALDEHIPDDEKVVVSAHFNIVPHIPFRETIFEFPTVLNADYVAVLTGVGTYPLKSQSALLEELDKYRNSPDWKTVYDKNSTVILKRVTPYSILSNPQ